MAKNNDHIITSVEPRGYIHFICPSQPAMELRSYDAPKLCPFCRTINPIKMERSA